MKNSDWGLVLVSLPWKLRGQYTFVTVFGCPMLRPPVLSKILANVRPILTEGVTHV